MALAQGATFNVSAQMKKRAEHNKSAVMKGPSPPQSVEKLGEVYAAHPFVLIIHHPGAC